MFSIGWNPTFLVENIFDLLSCIYRKLTPIKELFYGVDNKWYKYLFRVHIMRFIEPITFQFADPFLLSNDYIWSMIRHRYLIIGTVTHHYSTLYGIRIE